MNLDSYLAFVTVCLVAIVVPGPTNMLILVNGMRHGARAGLLNVAGTLAALAMMLAVAGLGLTSVIEVAGHWFEWLRLAGAAFLIWIGWKMIRGAGAADRDGMPPRAPRGGFFLQGLLVSLGNPKQLLFFGALLPQFIDPGGDAVGQIALLGITALVFAALSDGAYALASGRLAARLTAARVRLVARIGGGMLIGGGLWLAFARTR